VFPTSFHSRWSERVSPGKPTALLSLTDKTGLNSLAPALDAAGYRIIATPGTAREVRALGIDCDDVEAVTSYAPLLGGRVKTLHPAIFGGILARADRRDDVADLERIGAPQIGVVAVNLYRFAQVVANSAASVADVLEEIDIGGVALLRAAAKNYHSVSVLAEPRVYEEFIAALRRGGPTEDERRTWAAHAFAVVARYDAVIASHFSQEAGRLPEVLSVELPLRSRLRYGENPWEKAAFYHGGADSLPEQHGGKMLSYNNLLDVDACLRLIAPIDEPKGFPTDALATKPVSAAIVKHTIPCGLAAAGSAAEALGLALGADPISAFGGIVAASSPIDAAAAEILAARFLEVVAAPAFDPAALDLLAKKKNLRLLRFDRDLPVRLRATRTLRSALGGVLAEQPDPQAPPDEWRLMTERKPDAAMWRDLLFAFAAVRQVKSNAAVVARDQVTLGICGGQTNRVAAVELACSRAGRNVLGAALATDGFFPFADGIEAAIDAGIAAVIAPSGSIRDALVVEAARRANITLVFASRRYFLH
jgi:phosphoribosylaminoimidazolecarboxamide formyltransferase / IMP cyclohydrolase